MRWFRRPPVAPRVDLGVCDHCGKPTIDNRSVTIPGPTRVHLGNGRGVCEPADLTEETRRLLTRPIEPED